MIKKKIEKNCRLKNLNLTSQPSVEGKGCHLVTTGAISIRFLSFFLGSIPT